MGFTKEIIRPGNCQKPQRGQTVTVSLEKSFIVSESRVIRSIVYSLSTILLTTLETLASHPHRYTVPDLARIVICQRSFGQQRMLDKNPSHSK